MRLLPRTARGTWLLTSVIWLAWCATVWWALPVRPRAVLTDAGRQIPTHFSPDGRILVTDEPSPDIRTRRFHIWNAATGLPSSAVPDRPLDAHPTSFSPDGRWLLTSTALGQYGLWDVPAGTRVADLPYTVFIPVFSPTEPLLALVAHGMGGSSVRLLELPSLRVRAELPRTGGPVAFSPDGRLLATTDGEDHTTVWSVDTTRRVAGVPAASQGWGNLAFSPDSRRLVVTADNLPQTGLGVRQLEISVWDPLDGRAVLHVRGEHPLSPPRPGVLLTATERRLKGYDLDTGGLRYDVECPFLFIDSPVEVAARGRWLAAVILEPSFANRCRRWLAEQGIPVAVNLILDPTVLLIDTDTGRQVARVPGLREPVLSADGQTLAAQRDDGTVELWDIPPRKPLSWLAVVAALLALPLAWLARRRVRRLRRAPA
jgi:WD40 repeat protein